MKFLKSLLLFTILLCVHISCSNEEPSNIIIPEETRKELTIFHINDQHGSIENFSKIKYLVDEEKKLTNVMLVSAGDIFSGNPVVDNHPQKGFPMIDLMNKVGVDVSVLGNHEFDYGETILKERISQANFSWVCANVTMNNTGIPEPDDYKTIEKNNVKVTFLGLVETNGKEGAIIPLTHPWRVQNLTFQKHTSIIGNYAQIKEEEDADLYIALTHLGNSTDENLANSNPFFDFIIGGHSHSIDNEIINGIPIVQAGSNLRYLGKIKLQIKNKNIESYTYELIDLDKITNFDEALKAEIDNYYEEADLSEIVGYSNAYHNKSAVGSFYTDALRNELNVDFSIQNTGGIRNTLDEGDIIKSEIYSIDPFSNGSVTYTMTVGEIKDFLMETKLAIYYNGIELEQQNNTIVIKNSNQSILNDNTYLTIGLNDYIPAVYDRYFQETPNIKPFTTAETILNYFEHHSEAIDYTQDTNYFQFQ